MSSDLNQTLSPREIDVTPYAASLIEGHRDFGYSLETAFADVIDNAISAGASLIELRADVTSDDPWIAIVDNGSGMTEPELIEAMRLGSKNPADKRDSEDLGRFGLGLKSASFSQCRAMTVITGRDGQTCGARWDLDRIAKRNDWSLEFFDSILGIRGHDLLNPNGTVVIWEKLDRLSGGYSSDRIKRVDHMNSELARAERHLRLVFHRFLEGTRPLLQLKLNGRALKPIDPMASLFAATQKDPKEILHLSGGDVRIQCHTLPHHKNMDREAWEELGGPEGHLKSQGLYVYREKRLIIAGSWLGLVRQTELTKLCRITVDIPNTMDSEWKIDVKKASAQLPPVVRERLKKVVDRYVSTSKRTYHGRGQKLVDEARYPIWQRIKNDGHVIFKPNLEHPVFQSFSKKLPEELREDFNRCVRLLGSGLPIDAIHTELVGNAEAVTADEAKSDDLEAMVTALTSTFQDSGITGDALAETLQTNPLLKENWKAVEIILSNIQGKQ